MATSYRTLAQEEATLRAMDEDIADMLHTAVRIGERDDWDSALYHDLSSDIDRWAAARDVLAAKVRAMRAAVAS
jgi:hypothetical protein